MGSCLVTGWYGICEEKANTAGHEIPKCVSKTGQVLLPPCERGVGGDLILAFSKLVPLHAWSRSSRVRKLFNDGPKGVIVCPSPRAHA